MTLLSPEERAKPACCICGLRVDSEKYLNELDVVDEVDGAVMKRIKVMMCDECLSSFGGDVRVLRKAKPLPPRPEKTAKKDERRGMLW